MEQGAQAMLFASGMAAATAVFHGLAPGDHVLVPQVLRWTLRNWPPVRHRVGPARPTRHMSDPAAVPVAIHPAQTRLAWIKTPANPL